MDFSSPWALMLACAAVLLLLGLLILERRKRDVEHQAHLRALRDREERLRLALWASHEIYWDYDIERQLLETTLIESDGSGDLHERLLVAAQDHIHPDDLEAVGRRLLDHIRGVTRVMVSEHRVRLEEGDDWRWVRAQGRAVKRNAEGHVLRVAGTARDITHTRDNERRLRIAAEVMRSMGEAVAVIDEDFRFVNVNPAFTKVSGYTLDEVAGKDVRLMDSARHERAFYQAIRDSLREQGEWSGELWQRRKDGQEFLCALQSSATQEPESDQQLYVVVLTDITERRRIEQELRYLANYDTLTNLPNRTLLAERLSRAIVRARRQNSRMALLFLDLDRFKDVNDSLGHATGDRLLRAAAHRLQHTVGAQHTVARIGGDEFTVVLEDLAEPEDAETWAQAILDAFETPLLSDEHRDILISPSIGIALYPDHAQVPTELLKHADTAMYQAKAVGRRTFMRYTDAMDGMTRNRAELSSALRKVVERNELELRFQPQLSLQDGRISGVEALLRWHSPEHGDVPPAQFIPLAEDSGLIVEIGEWVLREACRTLADWRRQGLGDLTMAVNVSAVQLLRSDLPLTVRRILDYTGLEAGLLELELTESVLMANAGQAAERVQTFRDIGVSIAVDDFGTGYSSLAYLRRLPITTLKIDKAFIDDLSPHDDSEDAAITTTVIAMAHALGLNVVAEGVETAEQLAFLRQHRCDIVQGYWLAPPMQAAECLRFIREWPVHQAGLEPVARAVT